MDEALLRLVETGRFADALSGLRRVLPGQTSSDLALLHAELLERTGDLSGSKRTALRALSTTLSPPLECRGLTLLGTIALEEGDTQESIKTLRAAVGLAAKHRCLEQQCWAELRLLTALVELSPSEASAALIGELRRHVNQLGDPVVTCALHVFASELEAKRGALDTARRHARIARSLLRTHENSWIDGLTATAEFCIAYLSEDLDNAHLLAQEALSTYQRTGHTRIRVASLINLGHTHLKQDDHRRAERFLTDAWKSAGISPRVRDSVVEGFAQLALAKGEMAVATSWLERLDTSRAPELSYARLWGSRTKVRLSAELGSWRDALSQAERGVRQATQAGDRQLSALLLLLRAEARAFLSDAAGAAADIVEALAGHDEPPLELLGEVHRVLGRALAREGDVAGAAEAFARSARILQAIGHRRGAREALEQAAADGVALAAPADGDGCVPIPGPVPAHRPELLIQRAATLVEQASRPDLLGAEALGLLASAGAIRAAAVVSRDAAGPRVETRLAWTEAEASAPPGATLTIPLGTWRDREWSLTAEVPPGLAPRATWTAVRALATCGVALAVARREAREREALWPIDNPDTPSPGVFLCEQMRELLRIARHIASTDVLVLVTGETGVGKEVFARIIHDASGRVAKPFVPFNCSAVPREMLESQLFGHRKGAFTGAEQAAPGVIRAAAGGTLFLDEIGEVTLDLQPKLLRFLELGEIHPLGEPQPSKVDVRVLAATNRHLDELVREGRFREDLYYRLNVITLHIPPLRERREEIPGLAEYFLGRFARESHKGRLRIADETMEYLVLFAWPGNVRQLMNELRRMAALAETDAILMPEHLHRDIVSSRRTRPASERDLLPTEVVVRLDQPLAAATEHLERTMIQHAMALCGGHLEQVARMLGLSRKGLYLKRQRLGLDPTPES